MSAPAEPSSFSVPVVWFTGLSGAGKTTLAQALADDLRRSGRGAVLFDGDQLRQGLSRDLGFTPADRREQARRAAEAAALVVDSGIIAVVALVSPAAADRRLARDLIGADRFIEVYLDAELTVCEARDPKGLYARARAGHLHGLVGIDAPYEAPEQPDVVVDTTTIPLAASLESVWRCLRARFPAVSDFDI